jgi:5-methylcytosine-specific restriction enzyme A
MILDASPVLVVRQRSTKWAAIRRKHLRIYPACACCGGITNLEVHHLQPYHLYPQLELELSNLLTLCEAGKNGMNCHLLVGHLGSYYSANKNAVEDAAVWLGKLQGRP